LESDRRQCTAAGMDDYLSKPIEGDALIELVERLTETAAGSPLPPSGDRPGNCPQRPVSEEETVGRGNVAKTEAAAPIFSLDDALSRCPDRQMFEEVVDFFFADSARLCAQMHAALGKGDAAKVAGAIHRLRGTLAYLGAPAVLTAATQLERAANAKDLTAAAEMIGPLEAQLEQLKAALAAYRRSAR
jgi:two-component system, sensor histidine kinase and response regulator